MHCCCRLDHITFLKTLFLSQNSVQLFEKLCHSKIHVIWFLQRFFIFHLWLMFADCARAFVIFKSCIFITFWQAKKDSYTTASWAASQTLNIKKLWKLKKRSRLSDLNGWIFATDTKKNALRWQTCVTFFYKHRHLPKLNADFRMLQLFGLHCYQERSIFTLDSSEWQFL